MLALYSAKCLQFRRARFPVADYDSKLALLQLYSLAYRRLFTDLILCYKLVHGRSCLIISSKESNLHFQTCGHCLKLTSVVLPKYSIRLHSFSEHVCKIWNFRPVDVVFPRTALIFKHCLHSVNPSVYYKLYPFNGRHISVHLLTLLALLRCLQLN